MDLKIKICITKKLINFTREKILDSSESKNFVGKEIGQVKKDFGEYLYFIDCFYHQK